MTAFIDANSPSLVADLRAKLNELKARYAERFRQAGSEPNLREENAKVLGKKGELTSVLKIMNRVPPESKKSIGELSNLVKQELEDCFNSALRDIRCKAREADLNAPRFDLSLPSRPLQGKGHMHPISVVRDDVISIFRHLGFGVHDGPEVEREENNFTKLGFPVDHPATDMQDSFWTTEHFLLRTHTSTIQVRAMMQQTPPFAFVAPGAVYRRDDDATHSPMFHQLEAFLVDKHMSMAHLKGVLEAFATRFYGEGAKVRLRPSYFPFVEPGAEVDVACVFCKQSDGTHKGCSLCKHTGWIEILGCGMIHPFVFESCGIDPSVYSGFALGMGLERLAMLRYGVPNIRLFFENDPRFLAQF